MVTFFSPGWTLFGHQKAHPLFRFYTKLADDFSIY